MSIYEKGVVRIGNSIGKFIKIFRKKAGLTQPELANLLDVSFSTLRRWEAYGYQPRTDELKKLCEVLGCTESELLNGVSQENWELRLIVRKAGDPQEGVIDMTKRSNNAALYIEDDTMAVTLSGSYELWSDDAKFEELIEDLRRKRAVGLKARREDW